MEFLQAPRTEIFDYIKHASDLSTFFCDVQTKIPNKIISKRM